MPARRMCCLHSMILVRRHPRAHFFPQATTAASVVCLCGHDETMHATLQLEPVRLLPRGGCLATGCLGFQAVSQTCLISIYVADDNRAPSFRTNQGAPLVIVLAVDGLTSLTKQLRILPFRC